jgi:hypothetical protein
MRILANSPKLFHILVISLIISASVNRTLAQEGSKDKISTRYGLAGVFGKTFDPVSDINFLQLSGFIMWDYDRIWKHWAPDLLRFKIEASAGLTTSPENRAIMSLGMLALYYLEFLFTPRFRPYLEGGIGGIYTDFQVEGQGSRFNFNPQIGIGTEINVDSGAPLYINIRLSHISNGGLKNENRGVNAVVLMIGRFF